MIFSTRISNRSALYKIYTIKIIKEENGMLIETRKLNKREINVVTSLDVAETFEKEHYHVMEDIREIQSKISTPPRIFGAIL